MFQNIGEQFKEIIRSVNVLSFSSMKTKVTMNIGTKDEIGKWAKLAHAEVDGEVELGSQFRCNGSDGYLAWLDQMLQIRETANTSLEGIDLRFWNH